MHLRSSEQLPLPVVLTQLSLWCVASRRAPGEGIPVKAPAAFSSDWLIASEPS